jgi:hypothetical protein
VSTSFTTHAVALSAPLTLALPVGLSGPSAADDAMETDGAAPTPAVRLSHCVPLREREWTLVDIWSTSGGGKALAFNQPECDQTRWCHEKSLLCRLELDSRQR